MFEKVKIPVIGLVENMSVHICSQCGHQETIFGSGGGQNLADGYDIPLLGQLPLSGSIRQQLDQGNPPVAQDPESDISQIYRNIARNMTANLSQLTQDYSKGGAAIEISSWKPKD